MVETKRKATEAIRLKGKSVAEVIAAIEQATAPRDRHLLDAIAEQSKHYGSINDDRVLWNGEPALDFHGLTWWVFMLQEGYVSLPDRIPTSLLLAWRDAYVPKWGLDGKPWAPNPHLRCEDCKCALPTSLPQSTTVPNWNKTGCPVCHGKRIFRSDYSTTPGKKWIDPFATYRSSER
jgi:hypothetical protein